MQDKILCCVFNHNENAGAIAWWERLSPYFDTVILDSGSEPPCRHEGALVLDNIYYSGLMNKAWELLLEKDYRWLMVVTSDLEINAANTRRLISRMQKITRTVNVGLYQPSCALSWHGRCHGQSLCHYTWRMRKVNFQEGWFHLVCREVLEEVMPVDLSVNRLGWGIDIALSHIALYKKMLVLVDDRVRVIHPKGTGYNSDTAAEQMHRWLATLPAYVSQEWKTLRDPVEYRE